MKASMILGAMLSGAIAPGRVSQGKLVHSEWSDQVQPKSSVKNKNSNQFILARESLEPSLYLWGPVRPGLGRMKWVLLFGD